MEALYSVTLIASGFSQIAILTIVTHFASYIPFSIENEKLSNSMHLASREMPGACVSCVSCLRRKSTQEKRQQVYRAIHKNPDHINKVPVHLASLYRKMLFRGKIATQRANKADDQEDDTNCHV